MANTKILKVTRTITFTGTREAVEKQLAHSQLKVPGDSFGGVIVGGGTDRCLIYLEKEIKEICEVAVEPNETQAQRIQRLINDDWRNSYEYMDAVILKHRLAKLEADRLEADCGK